jgi:cytosine deaminase
MCESIREKGVLLLEIFRPKNDGEKKIKDWLLNYQFEINLIDDGYAWLSCVLALKASGEGNFGIGCVIVDHNGQVVIEGHNKVFSPYFRSDRHGEMVVINSFEDKYKGKLTLEKYVLYSSLESCPMCLTRLITSGIGKVSYVAPDVTGGMVHKIKDLPEVWHKLSENQMFDQAKCSKELIDVAFQIFLLNAEELNEIILKRKRVIL